VNLPEAGQIVVVHLPTGRVLASWRQSRPEVELPPGDRSEGRAR
jgi:hypothetical protein